MAADLGNSVLDGAFRPATISRPAKQAPAAAAFDIQWALDLADMGYRVFPCNPRSKAPLLRATAEGGWREQASSDPKCIRRWWHRFPNAMIGLPTGNNINALVIDVDAGLDRKTGAIIDRDTLLAELEQAVGEKLPTTWTVHTPRGGLHLYFALPDGFAHGNVRGHLPRHIDIRGDGGYVIAAGSVRQDGKEYTWAANPLRYAMAPAPRGLIDCITG